MDNNGFDNIELNERNIRDREFEDDRDEGETGGSEADGGNFADTNLDTGETTMLLPDLTDQNTKVTRVKDPDSKGFLKKLKNLGGIKRSITDDRKKSFKKIFDFTPEKKNGENNTILLDKTRFERNEKGNVSIIYKDKRIGNVGAHNKLKLFVKWNKNYVNEFRDIFEKAKQEYEKNTRFYYR